MQKRREEQYYLYLTHGAVFKSFKDNRYSIPPECYGCDFAAYSKEMGKLYVNSLNANENNVNIIDVGYARNDELFNTLDLHKIFEDKDFNKVIYWLPTFRQKTSTNSNNIRSYSSISIPFIHDKNILKRVNDIAAVNDIIIVIKPHPAQDLNSFGSHNLSNILFITNDYLNAKGVTNYELLGNSDALLSDYSSVYHDYLLCDKPVAFCWEDYDEYVKNEGIEESVIPYLEGGEKLYSPEDLLSFINEIGQGKDVLKNTRNEIKTKMHKHTDNKSTERTVNRIIEVLR